MQFASDLPDIQRRPQYIFAQMPGELWDSSKLQLVNSMNTALSVFKLACFYNLCIKITRYQHSFRAVVLASKNDDCIKNLVLLCLHYSLSNHVPRLPKLFRASADLCSRTEHNRLLTRIQSKKDSPFCESGLSQWPTIQAASYPEVCKKYLGEILGTASFTGLLNSCFINAADINRPWILCEMQARLLTGLHVCAQVKGTEIQRLARLDKM